MMILALIAVVYAQSEPVKNLYIMLPAIAVFMYGMMQLSAKTPSKNQENQDDNV